jgi:hypothetical protein
LFVEYNRQLGTSVTKASQRLGREATGGGGKRSHSNMSKNAITLRVEVSFGTLHQRNHPLSVCDERGCGVSDTHPSTISLKQRLPQFAFKFRNLLGHGGVCDMQSLRRGVDRSKRCNRMESAQSLET